MDNNISLSKEDECQRICTLQYKHFFREISQKLLLKSATFCSKGQFETQFWTIKVKLWTNALHQVKFKGQQYFKDIFYFALTVRKWHAKKVHIFTVSNLTYYRINLGKSWALYYSKIIRKIERLNKLFYLN